MCYQVYQIAFWEPFSNIFVNILGLYKMEVYEEGAVQTSPDLALTSLTVWTRQEQTRFLKRPRYAHAYRCWIFTTDCTFETFVFTVLFSFLLQEERIVFQRSIFRGLFVSGREFSYLYVSLDLRVAAPVGFYGTNTANSKLFCFVSAQRLFYLIMELPPKSDHGKRKNTEQNKENPPPITFFCGVPAVNSLVSAEERCCFSRCQWSSSKWFSAGKPAQHRYKCLLLPFPFNLLTGVSGPILKFPISTSTRWTKTCCLGVPGEQWTKLGCLIILPSYLGIFQTFLGSV